MCYQKANKHSIYLSICKKSRVQKEINGKNIELKK